MSSLTANAVNSAAISLEHGLVVAAAAGAAVLAGELLRYDGAPTRPGVAVRGRLRVGRDRQGAPPAAELLGSRRW